MCSMQMFPPEPQRQFVFPQVPVIRPNQMGSGQVRMPGVKNNESTRGGQRASSGGSTGNGSGSVWLDVIAFELAPERQKRYALLANQAICKAVLDPASSVHTPQIDSLRAYFAEKPVNPIGVVQNLAVFKNVMEVTTEVFERQNREKINELMRIKTLMPYQVVQLEELTTNRLLMAENMQELFTELPEIQSVCVQLLQEFRKTLKQGQQVRFGLSREPLLDKLARNASYQSWSTFSNVFLLGGFLNALPFVVPIAGHIAIAYMKLAKAMNANHTEITFFGDILANQIKDIHTPENPNDPVWLEKVHYVDRYLKHKLQHPWERVAGAGEYAETGLSGVETAAVASGKILEHTLQAPDMVPVAKDLVSGVPYTEIFEKLAHHKELYEMAEHANEAAHPLLSEIHHTSHSFMEHLGFSDNAIPLLGMMITLVKAYGVRNLGKDVNEYLKNDNVSNVSFLDRKVTQLKPLYSLTPHNIRNHVNQCVDFLHRYVSNWREYSPIALMKNTFKLLGLLFNKQGGAH